MAGISFSEKRIFDFCRKNGISKLSLFGSALREDFLEDSDIDILVEFNKERRVGFLSMARMEMELSEMLGRKVDLRTPAELSKYFRENVVKEAQVQYESK